MKKKEFINLLNLAKTDRPVYLATMYLDKYGFDDNFDKIELDVPKIRQSYYKELVGYTMLEDKLVLFYGQNIDFDRKEFFNISDVKNLLKNKGDTYNVYISDINKLNIDYKNNETIEMNVEIEDSYLEEISKQVYVESSRINLLGEGILK